DLLGVGGLEVAVLLLEAAVALRLGIAQVTRGGGVRQEEELDGRVVAAGEGEESRVGGEVEPAPGHQVADAGGGGGGEVHDEAERLAEVLVVVVAGDGEDGPAVEEELLEGALDVLDGVAQGVRPAQLAEQVAGDEED